MIRTRYLSVFLLTVVLLGMAAPASANYPVCWYGVVDITSVSGTDPDGTIWIYVTYYMGWTCTDGYLADERPYDPWDPPTGGGGDPDPDPDPVPGCSLSQCLSDCDAAYMEHAGVEVLANTEIHHVLDFECGLFCMEMARADWNACRGMCTTDCNLP